MVVAPRFCVMVRVRLPSTAQASAEPISALPMPIQLAAVPKFQPSLPA